MEGSESEAVFDSMNLNPRLFINEVLNSVDDLLDGAFHFFQQEASKLLNTDGTDRSEELNKGVSHVRNIIQAVLDKRLGMWEKYCLRHCFVVPEGFTLPKVKESPGDDLINEGAFCHPELHAQLDSLRKKLYEVQKESSELNRELHTLERQNHLSNSCADSVKEALKLYEQNSVHDMFEEMIKTASELRKKTEKLKLKSTEESELVKKEMIYDPNGDQPVMHHNIGISSMELEELQEFVADMEKMDQGMRQMVQKESPGDDLINEGAFCHPELDAQLDSLRKKLYEVQKESSELNREPHTLGRQNHLSNSCAASVKGALKLYEQNSVHDMFEEMIKTASELHERTEKLKLKSTEESERVRKEMLYDSNGDQSVMHHNMGNICC